ncbi:DUF6160 family protein [Noviherbaspirillum galbum]|uniref:DUF6160 domain-containing protein n=1 Tax=Noviherbaspirillum galbum TaxID=2709383 RepID=A0A6B3SWY7_9BURK|nr:DUF6160 family protein [Noviherbaspirillum galbum]NEX64015.1 hypothetical protein [Noviherbaspirillum galbum]
MKLLKKTAIAAALAFVAVSASAMTEMQDESLSAVSGQDGVSIAANLNVNIGEFKYTDTDVGTGGSVSFYNMKTQGLIGATIDVINKNVFNAILGANGVTLTAAAGPSPAMWNGTSDVVQIAIPASMQIDDANKNKILSMSVDAIRMGSGYDGSAASANLGTIAANANPSFGSFQMNQVDLRGTTAWIWAH